MEIDLDAPLSFAPLLVERVWGGRRLAELYEKPLPPDVPVGESWELVDRPDMQSVVTGGPLDGVTLHELWSTRRAAVFGSRGVACERERFPLILKLLDARETLSLQVHPPAAVAGELGGEPKTEAWLVAEASEGAGLWAGLTPSADRASFEHALRTGGDVMRFVHRLPSHAGDMLFVPSGRLHTLGGGNVVVEVQESSDTTYRLHDFGRTGLDGRPRTLHVEAGMRSIDFDDVEPQLAEPETPVVAPGCFAMWREQLAGSLVAAPAGEAVVVGVLAGRAVCGTADFGPGAFFLVPARGSPRELQGDAQLVLFALPPAGV